MLPIVKNQLKLIRLRNTSKAFSGSIQINNKDDDKIDILWRSVNETAHLKVNLKTLDFSDVYSANSSLKTLTFN
ncbi:MAG: sucrose phosphorylase [Algoriphagus sp.]|jgi:sucrose phosphorylase